MNWSNSSNQNGADDARGSIATVNSSGTAGIPTSPTQNLGVNKYENYSEAQLEEFAKVVSPKVSELLKEQALALDDLLDTPWSSDESSGDSDDYDSDVDPPPPSFSTQGSIPTNPIDDSGVVEKKSKNKGNGRRHKNKEDEDSMNEEWDQLEAAQLDLKDELDAATNGFAQMLYGDDDNDQNNAEFDGVDYYTVNNSQHSQSHEGEASAESKTQNEEWRDSIHQYYMDSNPSPANVNTSNATSSHTNCTNNNSYRSPPAASKPNHSYTLADHAQTLSVARPNRVLYVKPWLSRHELETSHIIKLPSYIARPSGEVSSRGREKYMRRMLDCTVEYIEPVKSKNLRRLFSGWNPGPGERRQEDEAGGESVGNHPSGEGGGATDGGSQRVMSYSPSASKPSNEDGDSSAEEDVDNFEDIEGHAHNAALLNSRRVREPVPLRTVTVKIRPDVLCGAVMDALTTSVERVGGEMTKRQGGHLRAILPGRKMRVWMPGEWQQENGNIDENDVNGGRDATPHENELNCGDASPASQLQTHNNTDDASSVTSGISSMLSPMLGGNRSSKRKGPKYDKLPPTIVDAQLVTRKVGKECQRMVLIRMYRVQDVARAVMMDDADEVYDVIAPLDSTEDGGMTSFVQDEVTSGEHQRSSSAFGKIEPEVYDPLLESKCNLRALQEASALVQRIKSVGGSGFAIEPPPQPIDDATVTSQTSTKSYLKSFGDAITSPIRYFGNSNSAVSPTKTPLNNNPSVSYPTVMELMSQELLRNHVPSPSVGTTSKSAMAAAKQRSHGLFPALSKRDVPYVKSTWIFLRDCVEELDRRRLAYSTLGIYPLFQFPALPTLDVHFIAQIKAFCRESMIVSLVKTASELEIYAREFEVSCGNVEKLLRPTFEFYKLAPPQLPMPVPLTAYPLDFKAPEEISPPWGPEVLAALENISNDLVIHSTETNQSKQNPLSSFKRSEQAISIVVSAFQRQNDVEQGARLGRKNMQVMDRLAKMQAHKRNSIAKIRASYGTNLLATKAADEFHSLRRRSSNVGSLSDVIHANRSDEVPLLTCNVLVGNAAGRCHVTHSHVLFNTQLVPILGGSKIHLFSILDVEVTINVASKSVLSPLPASISLTTAVFGGTARKPSTTREEVYNFIPSIGARRFAKFLEVLRDVALEDPNSLKFSEKGGLIYLAD